MKRASIATITTLFFTIAVALPLLTGCTGSSSVTCPVVPSASPQKPAAVTCNNDALTAYDELVLIVPHPDDEVLGFAGIMQEFLRLQKKVSIYIVTIGDGYCDACSFWKNVGTVPSMTQWSACSESDLADFGAIRKGESQSGQKVLGGPAPTFWEYPDTGLGVAWAAYKTGTGIDTKMRRSDCTKEGVFGKGSEINATPRTLYNQIYSVIANASPKALIGTTHPLDSHQDHTGLGNLIRKINTDLATANNPATPPKSVAFTVIHANSVLPGYPDADAWYPGPAAVDGAFFNAQKQSCYLNDTQLLTKMREYRYRPDWPYPMPTDAPYVSSIPNGKEVPFCLPASVYDGANASKLLAVQKFISQQGFLSKTGPMPAGMAGLVDGNGYQLGFVRSNEMFVLEPH